jgi:RNA polymerase sigma-54 factor
MLTARGIPIARRTVAKYRDELGIPPSNLRRRYD